jgi:hypothetical protein
LIDNLVRLQIPREAFQAARAKFAAVGASDLGRNANRSPVGSRTIKRRRGRYQNCFDQAFVDEAKQKFACGVAGTQHPNDVDFAEGKLLRQSCSEHAGQVCHFVKRLDALLVEPIGDLPCPIIRSAELVDYFLQLVELERLDVGLCVPGHSGIYRSRAGAAMAMVVRFFVEKIRGRNRVLVP